MGCHTPYLHAPQVYRHLCHISELSKNLSYSQTPSCWRLDRVSLQMEEGAAMRLDVK